MVTKGQPERLFCREGVKKMRGCEFGSVFLPTETVPLLDTKCMLLELNPPSKYLLQIKTGYWVAIIMTYFVTIHIRSPHQWPVSPPKLFSTCEHFSSSYYLKPESLHPERPQPVRNISSLASSLEFHSKAPSPSGLCRVSSLPGGLLSATSAEHACCQCSPPHHSLLPAPLTSLRVYFHSAIYVWISVIPAVLSPISFLPSLKLLYIFALFCQ